MICYLGESKVSLSEQDVCIAIQDFLNKGAYEQSCKVKVTSINIHRKGSSKAISVGVVNANHSKDKE